MSYDALGNVCSRNGQAYVYAGPAGCAGSQGQANQSPHAVRSVAGRAIDYDAQGRMRWRQGAQPNQDRFLRFDGLDRLREVRLGSALNPQGLLRLDYTPGGERWRRQETVDGQSRTTRSVGSVEFLTHADGVVETRRYLGGVAIETRYSDGTPTRLRYLFQDHLGSLAS